MTASHLDGRLSAAPACSSTSTGRRRRCASTTARPI